MQHIPAPVSPIPVLIVGAGPVGLALALGLARHGVRSVLLERKAVTSQHSKAPGIHVRTREILQQWGIEQRFLDAGVVQRRVTRHSAAPGAAPLVIMDYTELDCEADRPGILILEQSHTERLLLEALRETGLCDVRFGVEVVGLAQHGAGVQLTILEAGSEGSLDAEFVVGCDGAKSFVRGALDLPFEGITYSIRPMLADVRIEDERDALPWPRSRNDRGGLTTAIRLGAGLWRIIRLEGSPRAEGLDVTEQEVSARVADVLGGGPFELVWASRFRIHLRSAPRFRVGRVLLAGDAAHIHSPAGGLGMNGGIQDAHNLAWKLAYALSGGDTERLLDSYEVERRAVIVEGVSRYSDLLTRFFLQAPSVLRECAFFLIRTMFRVPRLRRMWLRRSTMIDLNYPPSPLLDAGAGAAGVRLPNLLLRSPTGAEIRLYQLLPYRAAILDVAEEREFDADLPLELVLRIGPAGYSDRIGSLRRLLGGKDGWILIRPDAHIAWAGHHREGLREAMRYSLGGMDIASRPRKLQVSVSLAEAAISAPADAVGG